MSRTLASIQTVLALTAGSLFGYGGHPIWCLGCYVAAGWYFGLSLKGNR